MNWGIHQDTVFGLIKYAHAIKQEGCSSDDKVMLFHNVINSCLLYGIETKQSYSYSQWLLLITLLFLFTTQ